MERSRWSYLLGIAACAIGACLSARAALADDDDVVARARGAYYGANVHGLRDFNCDLKPSWHEWLRPLNNPNAERAAIAALERLQLTLHAGPSVKTEVGYTDITDASEQQRQKFAGIASGLQRGMSGFFSTYSFLMYDTPLPEPRSRYDVAKDERGWKITYQAGGAVTMLDADYKIYGFVAKGPGGAKGMIDTEFAPSEDGLLLSRYHSLFIGVSGETAEQQAVISHQRVDGFQLPKLIKLSGTTNGTPFSAEVTLTNCRATKN